MRVLLFANPLPGLSISRVISIARRVGSEVWRDVELRILPFTEGSYLPGVGSGLAGFYAEKFSDITPFSSTYTAFITEAGRRGVIDCADKNSWYGQCSLAGSTADLGHTIQELAETSIEKLHLHLPRFMYPTDLGRGFLSTFSAASSIDWEDAYLTLRNLFQRLQVVVTFDAAQALTGFSGMAHSWTQLGVDAQEAQDFSREIGEWVHEIAGIAEKHFPSLLPQSSRSASSFTSGAGAGTGGGIGFLAETCDIPCRYLGEYLFQSYLKEDINRYLAEADLVIYAGGRIGEFFPAGLQSLAVATEKHALPCLAVTDFSILRRGEIPQYGLDAIYELDPDAAFLPLGTYLAATEEETKAERFYEILTRIARTWTW